ncbi:MAG: alanine racemase [Phycisphaeraceae bacterium]
MSPQTTPPTPYLRIDGPRVRRNLQRLADYCQKHNLRLSPHTKTHKSIRVGRAQVEHGAAGLTVAKVGEAEVMHQAADGADMLLAYPLVNAERAARLAEIAQQRTVRVGLDSTRPADVLGDAARAADATFGILIDLDTGMHRTGVQSAQAALELAQYVDRVNGLRVDGIFTYYGHIWGTAEDMPGKLKPVNDRLTQAVDLFNKSGFDTGIVTGGSTPTALHSHHIPALTEIRPGTYIYYDRNCFANGVCDQEDCAARIVATVVSDAVPDQVVLDAGSKTLTSDRYVSDPNGGHGHIVEYPEAIITKLSEEHGQVNISKCSRKPEVGERVTIIPNHVCVAVNMQNAAWWSESEDGSGELEPLPIDARGKLW